MVVINVGLIITSVKKIFRKQMIPRRSVNPDLDVSIRPQTVSVHLALIAVVVVERPPCVFPKNNLESLGYLANVKMADLLS